MRLEVIVLTELLWSLCHILSVLVNAGEKLDLSILAAKTELRFLHASWQHSSWFNVDSLTFGPHCLNLSHLLWHKGFIAHHDFLVLDDELIFLKLESAHKLLKVRITDLQYFVCLLPKEFDAMKNALVKLESNNVKLLVSS